MCTNTAFVNQSTWKLLSRQHSNKFFYGCVAHELNLLLANINDLFEKNSSFIDYKKLHDDTGKVVIFFRNHHYMNKLLRTQQK